MKRIEEVLNDLQPLKAMPTGVKFLDENLGGLYPGEVTVVCGSANDGNTALKIRIIHQLVFDEGIPVMLVLNGTDEQQAFLWAMAIYHSSEVHEDEREVSIFEPDMDDFWQMVMTKPLYFVSEKILAPEGAEEMKEMIGDMGIKAVFVEKAESLSGLVENDVGSTLKRLAKELQVAVVAEYEVVWWGDDVITTRPDVFKHDSIADLADNVVGMFDYVNHGIYTHNMEDDLKGIVKIIIMKHKRLASIGKSVNLDIMTLYCRDWKRAMEYETERFIESNPYIQRLCQRFDCELAAEEYM